MAVIVLPERKEHQPGLVFLDRVLRLSGGIDPGVPAASRVAGWGVFVPKVALLGDDARAELEESARNVDVPRLVHGVDRQGGVAWPHVAIGVAGEFDDVGVVGGEHGAATVDLGAHHQQTAPVQVGDLRREIGEASLLLVDPGRPVGARSFEKRLRPAQGDDVGDGLQLGEVAGGDQPLVGGAGLPLRDAAQVERQCHVDRALLDRVVAELAVLRITPGSLRATDVFLAAGITVEPGPIADLAAGGKAALPLVGDQALDRGVVHDGVADFGAVDVPVKVKEEADLALGPLVEHPDAAQQQVAAQVDGIVEGQADQQVGVAQRDVRYQRVRHVHEIARPGGVVQPGEPSIHPDPETAGFAVGVVLLADPRIIDVAQLVIPVERHQQGSVANRQVA